MLHLDPERLAALADDGRPTPDESTHLAACRNCAVEVDAHRMLRAMAAAAGQARLTPPLTSWPELQSALRAEGISRRVPGRLSFERARWMRLGLQAAAAVLLVGVGAIAGRWSVRGESQSAASSVAGTAAAGPSAQLASSSTRSDTTRLVTVEDALGVMQRAENDYRIAAAFVAAHDTSLGQPGPDRYRTRLAALDKVSNAALAAVNEAPSDPVVNQYLLSARSARAVTLQQLRRTLPTGYSLTSY